MHILIMLALVIGGFAIGQNLIPDWPADDRHWSLYRFW